MPFEIINWADLADDYQDTILLGNGASIAVDPSFSYRSLLEHTQANGLMTQDVQHLFDYFETFDFELILRLVWQAITEHLGRELGLPVCWILCRLVVRMHKLARPHL